MVLLVNMEPSCTSVGEEEASQGSTGNIIRSSGPLGSPGTYSASAGEGDASLGFTGNVEMSSGSRCSP